MRSKCNRKRPNGSNLYYAFSENPFSDNITIEAYSADEELLYPE